MTIIRSLCWFFLLVPAQAFWWSSSNTAEPEQPELQQQQQQESKPNPDEALSYGVDISFPMHYASVSTNYAWLPHNQQSAAEIPPQYKDMPVQPLGDMQSKYEHYIQGCVDFYNAQGKNKGDRCLTTERDRLAMSLRQPQSVYNYTQMGYTKIRAPDHVFQLLKEFWDKNKHRESPERWATGNVYT